MYYNKRTESGLWRLPSSRDGEEERVLPGIGVRDFAIGERGIYFAERAPQDFRIYLFDLETAETTQLYRRRGPFQQYHDLCVSPDEKWLLFGESPMPTSELILVENFH